MNKRFDNSYDDENHKELVKNIIKDDMKDLCSDYDYTSEQINEYNEEELYSQYLENFSLILDQFSKYNYDNYIFLGERLTEMDLLTLLEEELDRS